MPQRTVAPPAYPLTLPTRRMQIEAPSSSTTLLTPSTGPTQTLAERYRAVRQRTEGLCEPLETEDYVIHRVRLMSINVWMT